MKSETQAQANRTSLRFADAAEKHFAFLEAQGFQRTQSEPAFVRFESSTLFINIYHGRKSFEIGAELGRRGNAEDEKQPYPMSALLGVAGVPTAKDYRDYATHTPDGVNEGLGKLAELFRDHVCRNLQNARLFQLLKEQRQAWASDFADGVNLRKARRKLDAAWHAKNYAKVVELLEPLRTDLTSTELKKLEYAKKEIAES